MKRLLFDLEGNGLLSDVTKIHCIAASDVDTGQPVGVWTDIPEALAVLSQADKLIAHFGLGYDFPALRKVYDFRVPEERQLDTVVLARLKFPNLKELDSKFNKTLLAKGQPLMGKEFGKNTIAAWGLRLGMPKLHTDIEDWSQWTPEMQERCVGDVATNMRLWDYLKPDTLSPAAVELEHRVARLCIKMTEAGWPFDEKAARKLHGELVEEKDKVEKALKTQFGSWTVEEEFVPKVNNRKRGYVKGVPFVKRTTIEFNPNSRQHLEKVLRGLGWTPTEFTDGGQAKLDEEMIESVAAEYPEAEGITRYLMLGKRIGQLATGEQAWLKHVRDGRIHGEYNPIGAVTMRAAHFNPNLGQVPAVASVYGPECRALFTVPEGWEMVGADMSGLEGRCLAHYLAKYDGGAYGRVLLEGDPHWAVVLAVGFLPPGTVRDKHNRVHEIVRNGAKRVFYALLYGAGNKKLAKIVDETCRAAGIPTAIGNVRQKVLNGIEGFADLQEALGEFVERGGNLPGLDNRRIPIRSEHSALNTLLQSAGAILCKQWICDAYDALIKARYLWGWRGGDFVFLGWIHDELQVACRNGLGDRIGEVLTSAAREAGKPFKFRIALDSEYKVGRTWRDTH